VRLVNATSADFFRVSILSGANKTILIQAPGAPSNVPADDNSVTLNLSPFSGKTVRILIEAADAGTASLIEAAVDGITILAQ
jgi:aminopeptidase S